MKNAFIDTNGVLTSWGYAESNNEDALVEVPDDFDKEPGKWKYVSGEWVAYVAPVTVEVAFATRAGLRAEADTVVTPLQDALDVGEITAAEQALLTKWKKYRVDLSRIEQQSGFPAAVDWPKVPT